MNLRTFIERPVLSAVISITIVVVGIIGLFSLPVRTISRYCSADHYGEYHLLWRQCGNFAEECDCSFGRSDQWCGRHDLHDFQRHNAGTVSITVYFKQGTDPDMAAVNVQNRVSRATGQLPAEVTQVGRLLPNVRQVSCRCSRFPVGR